jgi:hypothetical protein
VDNFGLVEIPIGSETLHYWKNHEVFFTMWYSYSPVEYLAFSNFETSRRFSKTVFFQLVLKLMQPPRENLR